MRGLTSKQDNTRTPRLDTKLVKLAVSTELLTLSIQKTALYGLAAITVVPLSSDIKHHLPTTNGRRNESKRWR